MRYLRSAVLYTAFLVGANAGLAATAEIEALKDGSMKKLAFHDAPVEVGDLGFVDESDAERRLSDFAGEYVVLNFWATWCAPCREEMPSLDALQAQLGDDGLEVVTVATGRNPPAAIRRFFEEEGVENLPMFRDPRQEMAREMAVLGLPITVILDPEGREIARLTGDADWSSDSALAIFEALTAEVD